jgi:hypothetical protein
MRAHSILATVSGRTPWGFARESRVRIKGFWLRKVRWEFWPAWAAYLPVVPYIAYQAIHYRSVTLFTAANPGIPYGGFAGESKAAILHELGKEQDFAVPFEVLRADADPAERLRRAFVFAEQHGYPVVLKPDVGERGKDVAVIRSAAQLRAYLERNRGDVVVQSYVAGEEFGVFYVRRPGEATGRILSITEKQFPVLMGDGKSTLRELIYADDRAVCLGETYCARNAHRLDTIPANGEAVQLVELGSHCRGAIFLDGRHLITPALEAAIDRVSHALEGFYFGRYDVRADRAEALRRGEFRVLELNGVTGEPAHIYDPKVSVPDAYRTLFAHWRMAFEIGAANRKAGAKPATLREMIAMLKRR